MTSLAESRLRREHHTAPFAFFLATSANQLPMLVVNGLLYAGATATLTAATYVLGNVIDSLQMTGTAAPSSLVLIVVLLLGYEYGFRFGHVFEVLTSANIRSATKKALFTHTMSLSFGYFADRFTGEVAHKIAKAADALERMTVIITNTFVEQAGLFLVSAIVLWVASPYLGIYVIVWSALFILGLIPFARRSHTRANEYALQEARTTGTFVDVFSNIAAVKVYGRGHSSQRAEHQVDIEVSAYRKLGFWSIVTYHYMGLSIVALGVGLLLITTHVYQLGLLSIGEVVFISGVALRLLVNVWEVGRNVPEFIRQRGEAKQNLHDLIVAPAILDGTHARAEYSPQVSVEYRKVTFGYSHERPVLDAFSIIVKEGEKLGIVGLSGAGKTTFANLLLRFFDVQNGSVLLNGTDIREYSQEYLRAHVSYISQDTSLFHATVAENVAYGSPAVSRTDIERAAQLAYADEFIATLPEKYESIVGERGVKLSGGQRQRIAIARAILADRPLFLLDEATSALDSDSEQKIQKGLEVLMEGKTVIAIAHRLSTLSRMDRIVYFDKGKIVEEGTHDELLARDGMYAALWRMQAGGFLPSEI